MKSRNQQGSAHLVIIIALVVLVLGALGVIFWQNFINKESVISEVNEASATESTTDADKKLVVPEWGIAGNYESVEHLEYSFSTSSLVFTSSEAIAAATGGECNNYYAAGTVRYKADDVTYDIGVGSTGNAESTGKDIYETMDVPNASWAAKAHIGDYYYFLSKPQNACGDSVQESARAKVQAAAIEFLLDARTIE